MNDSRQEDLIGQEDLVFVIDTTSSMGPFIEEAKKQIKNIAKKAIIQGELSLRLAIVEYRDHPPEEDTFITNVHQFEGNLDSFQQTLTGISIHGGGDEAEAVYDGIIAAINLDWRKHASKNIWLVGDSPPHGGPNLRINASRNWIQKCPCGETETTCLIGLGDKKITLNAITLADKLDLREAFENLTTGTNGEFRHHQTVQQTSFTFEKHFNDTGHTTHRNRDYFSIYSSAVAAGTSTNSEVLATMSGMSVADIVSSHDNLVTRAIIVESEDEKEGE